MKQTKIVEVLGSEYSKDQSPKQRRRSSSRERVRRDSVDSVTFEKTDAGDEVSIAVNWSGDGVSMSAELGKLSNCSCGR